MIDICTEGLPWIRQRTLPWKALWTQSTKNFHENSTAWWCFIPRGVSHGLDRGKEKTGRWGMKWGRMEHAWHTGNSMQWENQQSSTVKCKNKTKETVGKQSNKSLIKWHSDRKTKEKNAERESHMDYIYNKKNKDTYATEQTNEKEEITKDALPNTDQVISQAAKHKDYNKDRKVQWTLKRKRVLCRFSWPQFPCLYMARLNKASLTKAV